MTIRTITFCALFWAAVALGNVILTSDPASITWVSGGGNNLVASFAAATATGGTITNYTEGGTNFQAHIFTNDGTFTVSGGSIICDVLVVAGGGGGAARHGGGGGAGGLIYTNVAVSGTNVVTVGEGGIAGVGPVSNKSITTMGGNGSNSAFGDLIAIGGGGGNGFPNEGPAPSGGSGGGGTSYVSDQTGGNYTENQGSHGGSASWDGGQAGGGGGGAISEGGNAASGFGGNGGSGSTNSISGAAVVYAGGGGGGGTKSGGVGGSGGGGAGASGTD